LKVWSREVTPYYEMIFPAKIIWRGEILSRSPIHRKMKNVEKNDVETNMVETKNVENKNDETKKGRKIKNVEKNY